ncbi:hypothetical protein CAPTEDRAFT_224174 [Capitella teleta]|uniref:Uncharacterized protein n=1 Tax=Capitella teleta TaxID=283909 RepID=R7T5P6_CAPTE|nr:hypothetical protein CAPTEDRAFT_224174 [Capitella teleta]|eukprot:ELT88704.1 hypothetical protein CAPTEDRAFT_224174 [Capitella teleta]
MEAWRRVSKLAALSFPTTPVKGRGSVLEALLQLKCRLIIGGEDGVVNVYELPSATSGETFDLKILCRKAVSKSSIECLQILQDSFGSAAVVTGDTMGHLWAFSPYSDLWRLRLTDSKQPKSQNSTQVQCLLTANLQSKHGQTCGYLLATDHSQHLHFIHQGTVVLTLKTPSTITAMCEGKFICPTEIETKDPSGTSNPACETQVALGSSTGAIYIMTNFEIYTEEFAHVQLPITSLETLPPVDGKNGLLCAGHFNALCVFREGKELSRFPTSSWVTSLCLEEEEDGKCRVVIGCDDRTVYAVQIGIS